MRLRAFVSVFLEVAHTSLAFVIWHMKACWQTMIIQIRIADSLIYNGFIRCIRHLLKELSTPGLQNGYFQIHGCILHIILVIFIIIILLCRLLETKTSSFGTKTESSERPTTTTTTKKKQRVGLSLPHVTLMLAMLIILYLIMLGVIDLTGEAPEIEIKYCCYSVRVTTKH